MAHVAGERREERSEQLPRIGEVGQPGGAVGGDVADPHEIGLVGKSRAPYVLEKRRIEDVADLRFIEADPAGESRAYEARAHGGFRRKAKPQVRNERQPSEQIGESNAIVNGITPW
jgi:hypothetical protein